MTHTQMPKVGNKVRYLGGDPECDGNLTEGNEYIVKYFSGEYGDVPEIEDDRGAMWSIGEFYGNVDCYELISEGADDMTNPTTRAEYWADKRREIEGATYTAEQRQARKGERIVIVEPNVHDSEDYERGDIFRVDKVDSAGVTTTTGNIVYHEEYEVLPEDIDIAEIPPLDLDGAGFGELNARQDKRKEAAQGEADNVHSPQHYRQGGVEVIDIIRDAVRDADGFEAVCHANVIKYVLRYRYKNGVEDVKKARVYLDWLIAELERKDGA